MPQLYQFKSWTINTFRNDVAAVVRDSQSSQRHRCFSSGHKAPGWRVDLLVSDHHSDITPRPWKQIPVSQRWTWNEISIQLLPDRSCGRLVHMDECVYDTAELLIWQFHFIMHRFSISGSRMKFTSLRQHFGFRRSDLWWSTLNLSLQCLKGISTFLFLLELLSRSSKLSRMSNLNSKF